MINEFINFTSSTIPLGTFTDLLASKRVTEVGFNPPKLRL